MSSVVPRERAAPKLPRGAGDKSTTRHARRRGAMALPLRGSNGEVTRRLGDVSRESPPPRTSNNGGEGARMRTRGKNRPSAAGIARLAARRPGSGWSVEAPRLPDPIWLRSERRASQTPGVTDLAPSAHPSPGRQAACARRSRVLSECVLLHDLGGLSHDRQQVPERLFPPHHRDARGRAFEQREVVELRCGEGYGDGCGRPPCRRSRGRATSRRPRPPATRVSIRRGIRPALSPLAENRRCSRCTSLSAAAWGRGRPRAAWPDPSPGQGVHERHRRAGQVRALQAR